MPAYGLTGVDDLRRLGERIAETGPKLRNQLRTRWREAAGPVANEAKGAIISGASAGEVPYHQAPGLREQIASTVRVRVQLAGEVSVAIVSYGSLMPEGKENLPRWADIGAWRHPVFGDREIWRGQVSPRPGWFTPVILANQPVFVSAAEQAANEIARQI